MAISTTYYIDTTLFSTATAVWTNSILTIKSPDGYYSFGGNYRQQVSGLLANTLSCAATPVQLNWSFSGFASVTQMVLYVNSIAVITITETDFGTLYVNVGDTISISVSASGCSSPQIKANVYFTGTMSGSSCGDNSSDIISGNYTVISGDIGTILELNAVAECASTCI
jgi:hypothetical protein